MVAKPQRGVKRELGYQRLVNRKRRLIIAALIGLSESDRGTALTDHRHFTLATIATQPRRVRSKRTASEPATRETADDEDARRARKATANRILTMLKAALNRAFHADRVASDGAWRKVKPFKRVDEAVVRYIAVTECRQLVNACSHDFQKLLQAALLTGCRYSELCPSQMRKF
jgi:hypothetical protein